MQQMTWLEKNSYLRIGDKGQMIGSYCEYTSVINYIRRTLAAGVHSAV
jgi:hypothetical protein